MENVLLAHELVRNFHRDKGHPQLRAKVDLQRAYDTFLWESVLDCLKGMNLSETWIAWVRECKNTTSFAILINGSPSHFFLGKRGLRQVSVS